MTDGPRLPSPPPLASLAPAGKVALFLDFDGTLVEIAAGPEEIQVPFQLAERLGTLAEKLEQRLALVSGRSPADLARHLGPLSIAHAGSHGIARFRADGTALGALAEGLPPAAEQALAAFAERTGILLERKSHGAALHFRARPEQAEAARDHAGTVAGQNGLVVKQGKGVVELVRPGANKGGAVDCFMAEPEFASAVPVFVGDDLTDEDGFRAVQARGGYGVIVGDRAETCADYRLNQVEDVYRWLDL